MRATVIARAGRGHGPLLQPFAFASSLHTTHAASVSTMGSSSHRAKASL